MLFQSRVLVAPASIILTVKTVSSSKNYKQEDRIMHKYIATFLFCLPILCTGAAATSAQTTSTISGTILDQKGAAIAGATVTARNAETNQTRTTTTNAEGRYVFPEMRVGEYEIKADMTNFRPT